MVNPPVLYTVALQSYTPFSTHIQRPKFLVYFEPKSLEPKLTFFHEHYNVHIFFPQENTYEKTT